MQNTAKNRRGAGIVGGIAAVVLLFSGSLGQAQSYTNFTIELGGTNLVPDAVPGIPVYPWFPDGHITLLPDGDSFQMYWAGSSSYRSVGTSIYSQVRSPAATAILSKGASSNDFDNGGAWLMSVFRQDGDSLIGFYHTEDHVWPGYTSPGTAWKSTAYCWSTNNGVSWTKGGQIITSSTPKPAVPTWGGSGDSCVVYDGKNSRWVCFYQENYLFVAISTNTPPLPGTWKKYYNGAFSEPGLGGLGTPIPDLKKYAGSNPSVHYNTCLKRWVMVWHTWNGTGLWLSTSENLVQWTPPVNLVPAAVPERCWYPTIIGQTDVLAGEQALICYARWPDLNNWPRQFISRSIRFRLEDTDADELPDEWERYHFGSITNLNGNADADPDGDGQSNRGEYLADTDPMNKDSSFKISTIHILPAGQILISWDSVEYKRYTVDFSTNLLTGWTELAGGIPALPPLNSYTNNANGSPSYYRIRLNQN